jgi:hypothetical protein
VFQNSVYNYVKILCFRVASLGDRRAEYRVLVVRPGGKRPLGRRRHKWEDNIEMDAKMNTNLLHNPFVC